MNWEYLAVKTYPDWGLLVGPTLDTDHLNEQLNNVGAEGWELVSVSDVNAHHGKSKEFVLIFKRPRGSGRF